MRPTSAGVRNLGMVRDDASDGRRVWRVDGFDQTLGVAAQLPESGAFVRHFLDLS
jgi:hypothetical protein